MVKLYVEEAIDNKEITVFDRAYELKAIKEIALTSNGVLSNNRGLTEDANAFTITISELYNLIKKYDKDFAERAGTVTEQNGAFSRDNNGVRYSTEQFANSS